MAAREAAQERCGEEQAQPSAAGVLHTCALVVSSGGSHRTSAGLGVGFGVENGRGIIDRCKQIESTGCERPSAAAFALTHHQVSLGMV